MLSNKALSKRVEITIIPLELEDFNGDKRAYFLSEIQNELSDSYVAQYGRNFVSLVIYEKNSPMAVWQTKFSPQFKVFLKQDIQIKSFALRIPIMFLRTRARECILIRIRKVNPSLWLENDAMVLLKEGKRLMRWNGTEFELYEYQTWDKIGIKYRSER